MKEAAFDYGARKGTKYLTRVVLEEALEGGQGTLNPVLLDASDAIGSQHLG